VVILNSTRYQWNENYRYSRTIQISNSNDFQNVVSEYYSFKANFIIEDEKIVSSLQEFIRMNKFDFQYEVFRNVTSILSQETYDLYPYLNFYQDQSSHQMKAKFYVEGYNNMGAEWENLSPYKITTHYNYENNQYFEFYYAFMTKFLAFVNNKVKQHLDITIIEKQDSSSYLNNVSNGFPYFIISSTVFSLTFFVSTFINEKQNNLQQMLYSLGADEISFYTSWILTHLSLSTIYSLIISITIHLNLFHYFNLSIIITFVTFMLYFITLISIAILFSIFFKKTKNSVLIISVMYIGLTLLASILLSIKIPSAAYYIMPQMIMVHSLKIIVASEV
jgi:hypothetical protein